MSQLKVRTDSSILAALRSSTRMLALFACLVLLASPYRSDDEDAPTAGELRIGQAFVAATTDQGIDFRRLDRELRQLQPVPVADLFHVMLCGEVALPRPDEDPEIHRVASREHDVLARVLMRAPRPELLALLECVAAAENVRAERELAIWVLGIAGEPQDIDLLARLARPAVAEERPARSTRNAFGKAVERIAARHREDLWPVAGFFAKLEPGLRHLLVQAVERARSEDGLLILAQLLRSNVDLDRFILAAMLRMADRTDLPVDDAIGPKVRYYFENVNRDLRLLAIQVAGRLEDYDAVPHLLALVRSSEPNIRQHAFTALRTITRSTLRSDAEVWSRWYEAEERWWNESARDRFAALHGDDIYGVAHAINEIAQRKLHRHSLAAELLPCLDRPEAEIAILACSALGKLGSNRAVPDLIRTMTRAETPGLPDAARYALRTITGRDRGSDPAAWREGRP